MKPSDVQQLARHGLYQGIPLEGELIETHISWVILSGERAFKIKKPIHYSFLDFSTVETRKYYCEREVMLNSRFADIYLGVLQIVRSPSHWSIGGDGEIVDYCVHMRRLDNSRKMDVLLDKGKVHPSDMKTLALEVSRVHAAADRIHTRYSLEQLQSIFNDILSVRNWLQEHADTSLGPVISNAVKASNFFVEQHIEAINRRVDEGYRRDLHGDLHARNIFLLDKVVLFDCIEFSDDLRQIDVLNEVAFLCMELHFFGRSDLADAFMSEYRDLTRCIRTPEEELQFHYYIAYRANVKAKVNALRAMQSKDAAYREQTIGDCRKYIDLMMRFLPG